MHIYFWFIQFIMSPFNVSYDLCVLAETREEDCAASSLKEPGRERVIGNVRR